MTTNPETIKTVLHYYHFDISKEDEVNEYKKLCKNLESTNLVKFAGIGNDDYQHYKKHIIPIDGKTIHLETKHLFNNQWNTAPTDTSEHGLRVFDWDECIFPNKDIKQGYWLEQTEEMKRVRKNTFKCGFCGAQYTDPPANGFCDKCLDSEYLRESELHLLRLKPIAQTDTSREPVSYTHLRAHET